MPVCYQFVRNADNAVMTLNDIDREMCEYWELAFNDKTYCLPFQFLTAAGISMAREKGHATIESVNSYIENDAKMAGTPYSEKEIAFIRLFMVEKYKFHSWWQPK